MQGIALHKYTSVINRPVSSANMQMYGLFLNFNEMGV